MKSRFLRSVIATARMDKTTLPFARSAKRKNSAFPQPSITLQRKSA